MTDVNSNIRVNIDSSEALAGLRGLQNEISNFNRSVITSNANAVKSQQAFNQQLRNNIDVSHSFSTSMVSVGSRINEFGNSLDRGKLKLGDYFKYGIAASTKFTSLFGKQHADVMALAEERVKRLQTQYVALGESAGGMTKALAVRPLQLFNADAAVTIQRHQILNKMLQDGSTSLINFGKNTQWAGRQLMVGFSVPLGMFAVTAGKAFKDIEQATVSFQRVYGDTMTTVGQTDQATKAIQDLALEYTKYGIKVSDTIQLGAKAAATGLQGKDLTVATTQATRLATLGQIDHNQALEATISLQSAFGISSAELGKTIDFLNAVENQTITSLDDITTAIPKVAPVIKGLGGSVEDLAVLLTAMREGGVSAAEGANALKSGLSSLIAPTDKAKKTVGGFGINLDAIAKQNKGNLMGMIDSFAASLAKLDDFSKQQVLTELFGKFQYARLGALFANINKDGSQAQRVMELTGKSASELASLSEKELGRVENAVSTKFTASLERLKASIAPIGKTFMEMATPVITAIAGIFDHFDKLNPGVKTFIAAMTVGFGVIVPTVTMALGLFANFAGQILKFGLLIRGFFQRWRSGGQDLEYLSMAELDAAAASASLEGRVTSLTSRLNVQKAAVDALTSSYKRMAAVAEVTALGMPAGFRPRKMATGGVVPGSGNQDNQPALLMPGETVITKKASQKYGPILAAMNAGNLPGLAGGLTQLFNVGSKSIAVNVASQATAAAFESRIKAAAAEGDAAVAAMTVILEKLSKSLRVKVGDLDNEIRSSQVISSIAKKTVSYNSPDVIRRQLVEWQSIEAERNAIEKRVKAKWGSSVSPSQMGALGIINASHVTKSERLPNGQKNWNAPLVGDLAAINNYNNRTEVVAKSILEDTKLREKLEKQLIANGDAAVVTTGQVEKELKKMVVGDHAINEKSAAVLLAVGQMDEAASLAAKNLKKNALGVNSATGYQASAAVGALLARRKAGTYYPTLAAGERAIDTSKLANQTGALLGAETVVGLRGPGGIAAASPSKKAKKAAREVAEGLLVGAKESKTVASQAGSLLGEEVIVGARRVAQTTAGTRSTGTTYDSKQPGGTRYIRSQAQRVAAEEKTAKVIEETSTKVGKSGMSLSTKVLGLSSAVGGAAFALSLLPGPVGEFASNVAMAAIALDSVVALGKMLSGTKVGLAIGGAAARIIPGVGAAAGGAAAAGGLGAVAAAALPVVAALAAIAVVAGAVYLSYKDVNDRVHQLGEAAKFTKDELEGLSAQFGFTPQKTGYELQTSTGVSREDAAKASEAVKSSDVLKDKIQTVKGLDSTEAAGVLRGLFLDLLKQGAPKDVAVAIVEQVANEAGKANVFVPVSAQITATLNDDGSIKNVSEFIKASVNDSLDQTKQKLDILNKTGFKGVVDEKAIADATTWMATLGRISFIWDKGTTSVYSQNQALVDVGRQYELYKTQVGETLDNLSLGLANGAVSAADYNAGIKTLGDQLRSLGGNVGLDILKSKITSISPEFAGVANKITDVTTAMAILQAAGAGADMSQIIAEINKVGAVSEATSQKILNLANVAADLASLKVQLASLEAEKKSFDTANASADGSTVDATTAIDQAIADLNRQKIPLEIAQIKIDQGADAQLQAELRKRFGTISFGIDIKDFDDAEYAISQIGEKIEDIQRGPLQAAQDRIDAIQKTVDALNQKQSEINHQIDLYRQEIDKINESYNAILDPLKEIKSEHQAIIDSLEHEMDLQTRNLEEQITQLENQRTIIQRNAELQIKALESEKEAYDKIMDERVKRIQDQIDANDSSTAILQSQVDSINEQVAALDKVRNINEIIARQQKNQLGLAEAITSGDMGAAAAALLETQQQAASDAGTLQTQGLENQKQPIQDRIDLIAAENTQLNTRLDSIGKERDEYNKLFDDRKKAIGAELQSLNDELDALTYQRDVIKDTFDMQIMQNQQIVADKNFEIAQIETQRDLEVAVWQQKIDDFAPALRDLTNEIYAKEQDIKQIQEDQIKPLNEQIKQLERQSALLQDALGDVRDRIEREKDSYVDRERALDLELQIANAKKQQADLAAAEATAAASNVWGKQAELDALKAKIAELEQQLHPSSSSTPTPGQILPGGYHPAGASASSGGGPMAGSSNYGLPATYTPVGGVGPMAGSSSYNVGTVVSEYKGMGTNAGAAFNKGLGEQLAETLKVFWNNTVGAIIPALQIQSPSKVFIEIGNYSGQGFINGIVDMLSQVPQKFLDLTNDLKGKWDLWWAGMGQYWTVDIPRWWTIDAPRWWSDMMAKIKLGWDTFWGPIVTYWTIDIPRYWTVDAPSYWNQMTAKLKAGWDTFWNPIVTWFTVDVKRWWTGDMPRWWSDGFTSIGSGFTTWIETTFNTKIDTMKQGFFSLFNPMTWSTWATNAFNEVKSPMNDLIDGLNNTIVAGLNSAADIIGLSSGGTWIEDIPRFARGGILPGYTPVSAGDDQLVQMRSGEGVIVSEALRKSPYEAQRLQDLNTAALTGSMDSFYAKHAPGFALGGVVGGIGGNISGLDPEFLRRLSSWNAAVGGGYNVSVGYRSYDEQARLYNLWITGQRNIEAAAPGTSWHQYGVAADLNPDSNAYSRSMADQFALTFPMSYEPWHIQEAGLNKADQANMAAGGSGATMFGDPLAFLQGLIGQFTAPTSDNFIAQAMGKLANGIPAKFIDAALQKITGFFSANLPGIGAPGSGVERWRPVVNQALGIMGQPLSLADTTLRRMNQESSGNPEAVNRTDSNWVAGHPSVGLMQVIKGTYDAYKMSGYDNGPYMYGVSIDPMSNILASMNYALHRYGSLSSAYNRAGGYAKGGIVGPLLRDTGGALPPGLSLVENKTGSEEWVFTPDQIKGFVENFVGPTNGPRYDVPSHGGFTGSVAIQDSGNVYNDIQISVVANSGDSTEDIANKVVEKIARLQDSNVRGIGGFDRVSSRTR